MRHRLNIWQPLMHSPLRFRFDSVSQSGKFNNGCVHSAVSKHARSSKITTRPSVNATSTLKVTFWAYIPSGNSTWVNDMDRHRGGAEHCCSSSAILPGHNRAAWVKRPSHASDQWLSRAAGTRRARPRRSRPIPAGDPSGEPSSIENNYWMKQNIHNAIQKQKRHSFKKLITNYVFIIMDKHMLTSNCFNRFIFVKWWGDSSCWCGCQSLSIFRWNMK